MPFQNQNQPFPPPNPPSQPHPQRNFSPFGRSKQQQTQSSEDDFAFGENAASERVSQPQSPSLWQRMKWNDSTVRLLIYIVHSVGDDVSGAEITEQKVKKTSSSPATAAAGQLKKGKWKSVSKAMMEKGFYVSPQQCEDKFNDLNKRYKRLNELLGKGTSCKVVENPALLDAMDYLPHKAKEEARKLLSSKHLFFREMCAYHNAGASSVSPASVKTGGGEERRHLYNEDDVADDEEEEEEEEEDEYNEEESDDESFGVKRKASSPLSLSLCSPAQGEEQQRQWLKMKVAELEEQGVVYQNRALQLEKQRFKWLRFSSNKEREMEKTRLRNERLRLENERMLLLLQQKEIRFLESFGNGGGGSEVELGKN